MNFFFKNWLKYAEVFIVFYLKAVPVQNINELYQKAQRKLRDEIKNMKKRQSKKICRTTEKGEERLKHIWYARKIVKRKNDLA